jgi:hypothetical protein
VDQKAWITRYFSHVRTQEITPNFWLSWEYIQHRGLVYQDNNGYGSLADPETLGWFFPPLTPQCNFMIHEVPYFAGFPLRPQDHKDDRLRLLDVQYIYDPQAFQKLDGHKWQVFRKNIRKASKTFPNMDLAFGTAYRELTEQDEAQVATLLEKWGDRKEQVYDPDVMVKFALLGEHRWGLFRSSLYAKPELVGINVADPNWKFVNYRLCIDNGEPYMQEYLRYLFYISPWVREQGKLVNDGGNLGSEGLARFKKKLNPAYVENIYTTLPGDK